MKINYKLCQVLITILLQGILKEVFIFEIRKKKILKMKIHHNNSILKVLKLIMLE